MAQQTNITDSDIVNWFGYHKATEGTGPMHQEVRGAFIDFAKFLNTNTPDGRAKDTAFIALQQAAMWTHKSIAEMDPVGSYVEDKEN